MGAYRTIVVVGTEIHKEGKAAATITPGQLIERTSTSGNVQRHSSAGLIAAKMFALEDDLQGKEIGEDYAADSRVQIGMMRSGDEVNALLADGQDVAVGDFLESNGDGDLRVFTPDSAGDVEHTNSVIGVALEALDLSDSSGGDPSSRRLLTEII